MRLDIGTDAAVALMVCTTMLSGATAVHGCEPSRYVDCRKVCAPAAVKLQDGLGRCECGDEP